MAELTPHGFKTKQLLCEVVIDGAIRVLNTRSGEWVMVQQSGKGVKQWVTTGKFSQDALRSYLSHTGGGDGRG